MGLFSRRDEKLSAREVYRELLKIRELSHSERQEIMNALKPSLDLGGITRWELKKTLMEMSRQKKLTSDEKRRLGKRLL
jgi:hypothetical protein